ncbi:H-X9-DG-CTERM domain-containing protein [Neoroseomonas lacus]|uniref:Uncharacterized protein n=1 Tax=Neoroseomonas lacus TaxID=287609 RepID=A0A917NLI7_9PROT|nr:H-X9-DG-CTERM domain-containing protein [Neoroseomonas lacus]GGJ06779.1 hypothetical protein GCM10011320_12130 [Neoroseomonas lacus]
MPVEIKELHIKATILPEGNALRFQASDASGKGTHSGGVNITWGDGSVRAVDDGPGDQSFAADDPGPVPTEQFSFNDAKIEIPSMDGPDLFF